MRRFLCLEIPQVGDCVTLDGPTSHHLLRVTGIAPDETVELFDGAGRAMVAALQEVVDGRAVLRVQSQAVAPQSTRAVWLLPALVRPAAMETIVRMATELGVSRITPVHSARVVSKGDKSARWQRIVAASATQSGRADLPQVDSPMALVDALQVMSGWTVLICAPGHGAAPLPDGPIAVLVGPEGGWTDEELAEAEASGAVTLGLGQTTLRADTAAVVALSRLMADAGSAQS